MGPNSGSSNPKLEKLDRKHNRLAWLAMAALLAGLFTSLALWLGSNSPQERTVSRAPTPASSATSREISAEPAGSGPVRGRIFEEFSNWTRAYAASSTPARRAELESRGIELARERESALSRLIQSDPEAALRQALPVAARQALPAGVLSHLERRISGRGRYDVAVTTPLPGEHQVHITRTVTVQGQTYQAYVYGRRTGQACKENIPLHGIVLGQSMALHESPIRILEPGEEPDPAKPVANPDGICPVKGVVSRHVAADAGDVIYYTCCSTCPSELANQQIAAENGSGPAAGSGTDVAASSWTEGPKTVLFIRANPSDVSGDQLTTAAAQSLINVDVNNFYKICSYNKTSLSGTVTPTVALPQNRAYYSNNFGAILSDARAAAKTAGYDTAGYNLDVVAVPPLGNGAAGQGYVGGKGSVLYGYFDLRVTGHELGHNYGVWHANYWTADPSNGSAGENDEYGDNFDIMGAVGGSFNAYFKNYFNWLTSSQVTNVTASGTYRIYTCDTINLPAGNIGALKVAKPGDASGRVYWAEFRQEFSQNGWLMNGAELHWAPWNYSNGGTHLLDSTFGSANGTNDAAVAIGRTYSDTVSGLHITPLRKGGTTPESLDVVVNIGAFAGNNPPTLALGASSTSVGVSVPVTLTATASDPNGDTLAYYWDVGDGTFMPNSSGITKIWNTTGTYTVSCTASDMKGGKTSASVVIYVSNAAPPVAQNFSLAVPPNTSSGITLKATDPNGDPLTYTVLTNPTHGTLSGTAPNLTYTPAGGYLGSDSFTFKANDGTADSNIATVSILVANVDPGLMGWWKMDDGGGLTAADSSGNGNTGTLTNGPVWTAGQVGGALSLDGSNDFVALNNTPTLNLTSAITMAAWIKTTGTGLENIFGSCDMNYPHPGYGLNLNYFRVGKVAYWSGALGDCVECASNNYNDGAWHHVAVTVSGTTATFYKDGVADGTAVTRQPDAYSGARAVGAASDGSYGNFSGSLDDVRIYNRALSAGEIAALVGGPSLPTVTVSATDANASETAPDTGTYTISRSGSTTTALTVNYAMFGTATNGTDYTSLSGSVSIAAGSATATITLTPTDDTLVEGSETTILTISPNAAYTLGSPGSATVTIADNDSPTLPTVTVTATDANASETASDTGTYTLSRTGSTSAALTVNYAMSGTATNGTDYSSLSGSVTIAAGSANATITLTPTDDTLVEGSETAVLTISANAAYTLGSPSSATVTITDNDSATLPTVAYYDTHRTASEAGEVGSWTYTRTGSTAAPLTLFYAMSGTATNGADYSTLSGSVTFDAGSAYASIWLNPIDDTLVEGSESAILTLSPNAAYTIDPGSTGGSQATIADNDIATLPIVTVTATDANASESAPDTGTYTFNRTGSTATALSVNYVMSGTATNGTDYTSLSGTVSIAAGSATAILTLTPTDDTLVEGGESAILTLSANAAYTLGSPNSATVSIADNDSLPTVTVTATDANASETGPDTGTFTLSRTGSTATALTVNYTLSGTATHGADYTSLSGSVSISAGSASASITLTPIDDTLVEGSETAILTISANASYSAGSPSNATVNINDNDSTTLPTVSHYDAHRTASEAGEVGSWSLIRTGGTATALTVFYAMSGTATNGTDYSTLSGSATFDAGSATASIWLAPIDDTLVEGSESAILTISPNAAYNIDSGSTDGSPITIADNDTSTLPVITVAATDSTASETAPNPGAYTLTRSGSTAAALTVNYALSGTATNGADYTSLSGSVSIAAGSATATITLTPTDDTLVEGSETAILTISPNAAYTLGSPSSATITIADNDSTTLSTVSHYDAHRSASEAGEAGSWSLVRTGSTAAALTVFYAMSGTALNGTDYASLSGSVTFAAGSAFASIWLIPMDDTLVEISETATLTISPNAAYTVGSSAGSTVTIADNDASGASLVTSPAYANPNPAGAGQTVTFSVAASNADGDTLTYAWTFGDGTTGSGSSTTHTYAAVGTYAAGVMIYDNHGGSVSSSVEVVVTSIVTLQNGLNGYAGTRDTYLSKGSPSRNYGSTTSLLSARNSSNLITQTMLVRFAIFQSEGGPVPDGATIQSATLSLYKYSSYDHTYEVHRLLKNWNELEASWNSSAIGAAWSGPGALGSGTDMVSSADGQAYVGGTAGWLNLDVTAGVRAFASGAANNGWHLVEAGGKNTAKKFYSREYTGSVSLRPKLKISYTAP